MLCKQCGTEIADAAAICVKCGVATGNQPRSRFVFFLLAFFLGALGIHNFYAGYNVKGIIQLLITLVIGWLIIPLILIEIWVIAEIILVSKDAKGNKMNW